MATFTIGQAASLLGVSSDTVRRSVDAGDLVGSKSPGGHRLIDGVDLARFAEATASTRSDPSMTPGSARNRFTGLVTRVTKDTVMAQVELICGPFRVVSLISREAVDELGLEPGVLAVASIKATNVMVDVPDRATRSVTAAEGDAPS